MSFLPATVRLFPLPQVVLFPRTFLPLHIFEPRYKTMVNEAWDEDRVIGMILLQEGWEADYEGRPPIYPIGCAGKIIHLQPLEDGRHNLILHGMKRFQIEEEFGTRPFRQASVQWIDEDRGGFDERMREEIRRRVKDVLRRDRTLGETDALLGTDTDDDASFVHTLSFFLPFTPLEKQFLLESSNLGQQARRLLDLLSFVISSMKGRIEGTS